MPPPPKLGGKPLDFGGAPPKLLLLVLVLADFLFATPAGALLELEPLEVLRKSLLNAPREPPRPPPRALLRPARPSERPWYSRVCVCE